MIFVKTIPNFMKIQQAILQLIIRYRLTGELFFHIGSVSLLYHERPNNPVVLHFREYVFRFVTPFILMLHKNLNR